jgi:hypothetical protein
MRTSGGDGGESNGGRRNRRRQRRLRWQICTGFQARLRRGGSGMGLILL